ncbi:hypothetical protein [Streptomyces sp. NPDC002187]|uniref:hypothetical protein n=1 Tax=Streptomyces sp. NPDC002187 TaxID=3364637 RepID=UPI00368C2A46
MISTPTPDGSPIVRLYALLDIDGRRRYIGISGDPQRRSYDHWANRRNPVVQRKNPALCAWLDTLDGPPAVLDLGPVAYEQRHVVEGACVLAHRSAGCNLLNVRIGMRQPFETRVRISLGMRRFRARQRALASS